MSFAVAFRSLFGFCIYYWLINDNDRGVLRWRDILLFNHNFFIFVLLLLFAILKSLLSAK